MLEKMELTNTYKKGKIWRNIIVEKSVIASSNSILQLAANGVLVNSENAKALSTYLLEMEQLNYEEILWNFFLIHIINCWIFRNRIY